MDEVRETEFEKRLYALPVVEVFPNRVLLIAYEGDIGKKPLFYNRENQSERVANLRANEILATRTHALIDLKTRTIVVEYNRGGAKAYDLLNIIWNLAKTLGYENLTMEMPPIIGESFLKELAQFRRVRMATIKMVRPNTNWNDCEVALAKTAEDSDAQMIEVSFSAAKKESLSKSRGLLGMIKEIIADRRGVLKNVQVFGKKTNAAKETSVKLHNHLENRKVEISQSEDDGHPNSDEIKAELHNYLNDIIGSD